MTKPPRPPGPSGKTALFAAAWLGAILIAAPALADEPGPGAAADPAASPAEPEEPTAPSEGQLAALRRLFDEGKELEKAEAWSEALDKFRQVGEVLMTPQVRFHIAFCEEKLGRLTRAINGFERAAAEARAAGKSAADVAENAPARAEALRRRVPTVVVAVRGRLTVSRVLLDGAPVLSALFGTRIPVDPGEHRVEIEREGRIVERRKLDLAEGESETVELVARDPAPEASGPPARPDGSTAPPKRPEAPTPSRTPAFVAFGVGAAGLVASGIFFALRESAIADVRATCTRGDEGCDPALRPRADEGRTFTTASAVLGGVGAAALVTGGVLFFALEPPDARPGAASITVRLGPSHASARVRF